MRKRYALLVLGVCVLATLVLLFLGVYKFDWSGKYTASLIWLSPFSAATVDGQRISLAEFKFQIDSVNYFVKSQKGSENEAELTKKFGTAKDVERAVLDNLVTNEIYRQLNKKYGLEVKNEDLDQEYKRVAALAGGEDKMAAEIKRLYNWGVDDFKRVAMRSNLQKLMLQDKYNGDETIDPEKKKLNLEVKKRAEDLLARIKKGEDFAKIAKEFSDDKASGEKGGDLGYFGRGEMVPSFEDAAFALKKGEISEVVQTEYGYHIIKVEDIKDDKVQARHILLQTQNYFNDWLTQRRRGAKVRIYVPGLKWNRESGIVEKSK